MEGQNILFPSTSFVGGAAPSTSAAPDTPTPYWRQTSACLLGTMAVTNLNLTEPYLLRNFRVANFSIRTVSRANFLHTNLSRYQRFLLRTLAVSNLSPHEPYLIRTFAYEYLLTNFSPHDLFTLRTSHTNSMHTNYELYPVRIFYIRALSVTNFSHYELYNTRA